MDCLAILPRLLEQAACDLRASQRPRDEGFEELSFAIDLALVAAYRFNAEDDRAAGPAPQSAPRRTQLVLVSSCETPSMPAPSARSLA